MSLNSDENSSSMEELLSDDIISSIIDNDSIKEHQKHEFRRNEVESESEKNSHNLFLLIFLILFIFLFILSSSYSVVISILHFTNFSNTLFSKNQVFMNTLSSMTPMSVTTKSSASNDQVFDYGLLFLPSRESIFSFLSNNISLTYSQNSFQMMKDYRWKCKGTCVIENENNMNSEDSRRAVFAIPLSILSFAVFSFLTTSAVEYYRNYMKQHDYCGGEVENISCELVDVEEEKERFVPDRKYEDYEFSHNDGGGSEFEEFESENNNRFIFSHAENSVIDNQDVWWCSTMFKKVSPPHHPYDSNKQIPRFLVSCYIPTSTCPTHNDALKCSTKYFDFWMYGYYQTDVYKGLMDNVKYSKPRCVNQNIINIVPPKLICC